MNLGLQGNGESPIMLMVGVKGYAKRGDAAQGMMTVAPSYAESLYTAKNEALCNPATNGVDGLKAAAVKVVQEKRVVKLVDIGLSGKTSILLNVLQQLVKRDSNLRWVYIPCDVSAGHNSKSGYTVAEYVPDMYEGNLRPVMAKRLG